MDANLDNIAKELYGKIQTRFPSIKIGDESANVLSKKEDIPKARFFEFEYSEGGEPLGTITMTLDNDDGLVIQVSGDLVDDDSKLTHAGAWEFIKSFRKFAKNRMLSYDASNLGKSNLDKRDYNFLAKSGESNMMESKLYGSSRISYQDLGEARLVVKHTQPINPELAAGRTMHIESIYIENADGERFKYPYKHLNGARALAEHIKHGGNPYDGIGKHICGLSEELAHLRKFKGYVNRQEQLSEAMANVTSRVAERIDQIKETISKLQRSAYYEEFVESYEAQEEQLIPEEVQNDLIDRLTIRTFNEELKSVFPYIYKFVDESELPVVELGVEDLLVNEDEELSERATPEWIAKVQQALELFEKGMTTEQVAKAMGVQGPNNNMAGPMGGDWGAINYAERRVQKPTFEDPEMEFESFMDSLISEDESTPNRIFSDDNSIQKNAVDELNSIFSKGELKAGGNGLNGIQTLKGLIDDPELANELDGIDSELDIRPVIQAFIQKKDEEFGTDVASQLHFDGEDATLDTNAGAEPAPAEPAPAEPAQAAAPAVPPEEPVPAQPVAEEGDDDAPFDGPYKKPGNDKDEYGNTVKHPARHLAKKGLRAAIAKAKAAGAKLDTRINIGGKGMTLHDAIEECGMTPMEVGFGNPEGPEEFVSGYWSGEDFPLGGTRIKIKLKKAYEEGEFGDMNDPSVKQAVIAAIKKIDQLDPSSNELQSIKHLAGMQGGDLDEMGQDHNMPDFDAMMKQIQGMPGAKTTNTSSGTINGKPASYDDAMNKFKQMKLKIGNDEIDFNNPDQAGDTMKNMMGGIMQGVQGQVPNQNMQIPGGQINPSDMMKQIMQKINFGK